MKYSSSISGFSLLLIICLALPGYSQQSLVINDKGYFEKPGLNVMVFSDYYPDGHQTGVTVIQHGLRVAANGDLRLEPSPGQWSPVPRKGRTVVDKQNQKITTFLWYPDSSKNRKGFNPIDYPDLVLRYNVSVNAMANNSFRISVDLDAPLPEDWIGKVGFNFELFPGHLFGKSYIMDEKAGQFQTQPSGPLMNVQGEYISRPLVKGKRFTIAPEDDKMRMTIESKSTDIELYDGRTNHNNGWYIVRSVVPAGVTTNVIEWIVTPNVVKNWLYAPVIQVSQVGYHTGQSKKVVIEQDPRDTQTGEVIVYRITPVGKEIAARGKPVSWGRFLRYNYLTFDFSSVKTPGVYVAEYRSKKSNSFQISEQVYDRGVWQPVLEYFLPVQMCHMRINEKYRVWHGACHLDDALMAPVDLNHFDGYLQGPSTLTKYKSGEHVPGLNSGGWHDAGDYDLRVESQSQTVWCLASMIEEFGVDYDATLIDQENKIVEIHVPDNKSDAVQQIEHGLLSILGGYRSLGRLYRGIICPTLRQYVLLGDGSAMTNNFVNAGSKQTDPTWLPDDRWVFTEENPNRSLQVAGALAAASRVLKNSNPSLSDECIKTALELWKSENEKVKWINNKVFALSELILATGDPELIKTFAGMKDGIVKSFGSCASYVARVIHKIPDEEFKKDITNALSQYMSGLKKSSLTDSPYGVPYRPDVWGAGWTIMRFGVQQYFIHKAWPEYGSGEFYSNALNFVLGVHPGENTASFASGIGSESVLVAYGTNREDWSYIPGGVVSGTGIIRPDLPELKEWPYFWQQTEYVMGEGSVDYMFLVLAVQKLYSGK